MIQAPQIGPINSLGDAEKAIRDLERAMTRMIRELVSTEDPAPGAGTYQIVVRESDGTYHLWNLVGGSGSTLTYDLGTRTATLTVP